MFSFPWDLILQGSIVIASTALSSDVMKLTEGSGALRATKNSGLQPAMDFILEHNDDPIPDPTSSAQPQSEPINVDDEDDIAVLGLQPGDASQAGSSDVVEARVSKKTYLTENWWRFLCMST
jgi:hypothetical protein